MGRGVQLRQLTEAQRRFLMSDNPIPYLARKLGASEESVKKWRRMGAVSKAPALVDDGDPDAPRCFYCNKRVSPSAPYTPPGSRGVYCNEVCAAAKREAMEAARRARVAGG